MEDADFDVTFGPNVYLAKQISRNSFAFKGPTGRVFYMRKKKGKWILTDPHGYYFHNEKFTEVFLKNKDDWIIETLLLGGFE